jgi:hypothetical protein
MTETLLYQSRVKSSAGNYGFSTFKVGDGIVIQLENLSDRYGGLCLRWQYLDNATGEITAINGNKAFVLLDESSYTVEIELCLLTQISSQDSEFLASPPENWESQQTYAASGTNSVKESCEKTSQVSPSVETSLISTFQTITEPSHLLPEDTMSAL